VLLSMTGHGQSHASVDDLSVSVELRAVNNRYLKLNLRVTEGYSLLEPRIESLLREGVRRGTLYANIRIERHLGPDDFRLNLTALRSYQRQLAELADDDARVPWEALLQLPGVVDETVWTSVDAESVWPLVREVTQSALVRLGEMRQEEGRAMATDLATNRQVVSEHLEVISQRAPAVIDAYRGRLTERLGKLLADFGVTIEAADVVREVGIFAERSDIAEEIVRLRSHLLQFDSMLAAEESSGRKLEFLTQEMFRETNTIGSKSNDSEIGFRVIEIKTAIERIREMIQNIE
jgi:uncharacterized protein (TIGR00255 family)